jgi:hypothetical protein
MIESYSLETRVQLAQRRVFQTCGRCTIRA